MNKLVNIRGKRRAELRVNQVNRLNSHYSSTVKNTYDIIYQRSSFVRFGRGRGGLTFGLAELHGLSLRLYGSQVEKDFGTLGVNII